MKQFLSLLFAAALLAFADLSFAQECEQVIESNDMMQFNTKEIIVSSDCSEVTITLKHVGDMDAQTMGHNWVLTTDADWQPVAQAGAGAGADNQYVPQGDSRVIANTDIVGGGEQTSVTFGLDGLEPGGSYKFFCSFPGHYAIMNGTFVIQ